MARALAFLTAVSVAAEAQCPGGGVASNDRCWYLSNAGDSCGQTCQGKGLTYSHFVAGEASPMVPRLLGRDPATRQGAWGRIECYVPSQDRFHTAKAVQDGSTGDKGQPEDWKEGVCRLSCACSVPSGAAPPAADSNAPYPQCAQQGHVFRHAGAHAIFVDFSAAGSAGCWQNDCKNTDKFNTHEQGICARWCAQTPECTHWSFGEQDGSNKCFFRKSDGGGEASDGWVSGSKSCAPPAVPDALMALKASEVVAPCDAGKSDACPDMARAVTTWRFAIKHLKKATEGKLDAGTMQYVNQVASDTDAFAAQMSEENFPVVAANNRQVFNSLTSWLQSQGAGPAIDTNDASLPNPVRGKLCGQSNCHEEL